MHQAVQVQAVGHAGVALAAQAPPHAEQHFEHRVATNEASCPGRHLGVARWHQHGHPRQAKAQQVGSAVAQKQLSPRPVDQAKAQPGGAEQQGCGGQGGVAQAQAQQHKGAQADAHGAHGQAIETVHNVDGVGHAAHGHGRDQHGKHGVGQQIVEAGHVQTLQAHVGEQPGEHAAAHGDEQAGAHANAPGDVFQETNHKRQAAGQQQRAQQDLGVGGTEGVATHQAHHDGQATDAGGGLGVGVLYAALGVKTVLAVPARGDHSEHGHEQCSQHGRHKRSRGSKIKGGEQGFGKGHGGGLWVAGVCGSVASRGTLQRWDCVAGLG